MDTVRAELRPEWVLDHQLRGALLLVFLEIFSSSLAMEEVWCHPEEVDLARLRSTRVVAVFAVVGGSARHRSLKSFRTVFLRSLLFSH